MDATYIARKTAGLTGFDRADAFGALVTELTATIATGTLSTQELLDAVDLANWLRTAQADAARRA